MTPSFPLSYMVMRVASSSGRAWATVLKESHALTVWTYHQLQEHERMEETLTWWDQDRLATLESYAMHDPKKMPVHDVAREWGDRSPIQIIQDGVGAFHEAMTALKEQKRRERGES